MACLEPSIPILDLEIYSRAYFSYLDAILSQIPPDILSVMHTSSLLDRSSEGFVQRCYTILHVLSRDLSDEPNHVFLRTVCTQLEGRDPVIKETHDPAEPSQNSSTEALNPNAVNPAGLDATSGNRAKTAQLIFILLGFLTMFYDPTPNPVEGTLQMRRVGWDFTPNRRNTATWEIGSQDVSELGQDISFDDLLCRYSRHAGPIPIPRTQQQGNPVSGILRSEDVSFYTLTSLFNVKIIWTTSICEHLEFNARTKQLKLFRFPSFCVLICLLGPERTFLDG